MGLVVLLATWPFIADALPWTGRTDLERVRTAAILERPPGAVLVDRDERRTKENVFMVGRQGARVQVIWASALPPEALLEHYWTLYSGEFGLSRSVLGRLGGCVDQDCAIVRVGTDPTFRGTQHLDHAPPPGARSFALVAVAAER
ncbi:MAG: hypothetical protein AB7V62_04975 [Thermoleophilia bacterium]